MTHHQFTPGGLVVALFFCLWSPVALGDAGSDQLKQAIQHFDLARFEQSRQALTAAQAATRDPKTLARVLLYFGLIEAVSGSRSKARTLMVRALEQDPALTMDPARFKKDLVQLFDDVRKGLRGGLLVHVKQPAHTVFIDGKRAGQLPLLTNLPVGRHRIEVKGADGRTHHSDTVVVRPHDTGRVIVDPVPTTQPGARLQRGDRQHAEQTRRPPRRILTWIAAGTAVAMLGTGIGLGVSAAQEHEEWEASCKSTRFHAACDEQALTVENRDLAANVMFVVGGTLAAAAVALYFLEGRLTSDTPRKGKRSRSGPQLVPVVGSSTVGGALTLTF